MYIGVYSAAARTAVNAARSLIAQSGFQPDHVGIRRFRALALERMGRADPRAVALRPLAGFIDFHSTSMCRDLVFHVQEHQFTPRDVAALARDAGCELLGFGLDDDALAADYRRRNPGDPLVRDPARIAAFERAYPHAFAAMYLALLRKSDA